MIDADTHVIESDDTWSYLDDVEEAYRPVLVTNPKPFWLIDNRVLSARTNMNKAMPAAILEMRDIEGRLRVMDELGTDVQVLYPSIFLKPITNRTDIEHALCKSYNRWLADVCRKGEGRLQWVAVLPLMDMSNTLAEVRFAKANGACGLFTRGLVDDHILSDAYFFPLYEEAEKLGLAICVHASQGNLDWVELFQREGGFAKFKLAVLSAFHSIVHDEIPQMFPSLRFAFVEVSAQWIPYVTRELERRFKKLGKPFASNWLRDNRLYVACQTDDDLPYIVAHAGEDNLVIGSDFGHADTSSEMEALQILQRESPLEASVAQKILDDNARALYGL